MARVVTEDSPRDTVVVEREGRNNIAAVVVIVLLVLAALWLFTGIL